MDEAIRLAEAVANETAARLDSAERHLEQAQRRRDDAAMAHTRACSAMGRLIEAAHPIAAFDPPTMLALLEAAEAKVALCESRIAAVAHLAWEWERTSPAWIDPVGGPVAELRAALEAR